MVRHVFVLVNSPLVSQVSFAGNGATMKTTKNYDFLNRLQSISSVSSAPTNISYSYQYNLANQRTRAALADSTYWVYGYDSLGQVTMATVLGRPDPRRGRAIRLQLRQHWQPRLHSSRRRPSGANLRSATYGANPLNQYTNR